jgi:hypothetical protein
VLGTVKDSSGSLVPAAKVDLLNTGTNAVRSTITTADGLYEFVNVDVGTYSIKVEAPGFQVADYRSFALTARATVHIE